jgi:hypothetical protein
MKKDIEQLIDRAIANERANLPLQPSLPSSDLLTRVSATPASASTVSVSALGLSLGVKVAIVAFVAAGSATWWALSQDHQPSEATAPPNPPEHVQSIATDSAKKPADSSKTPARKLTAQKRSPAPAASPFTPNEHNLPEPNGPLETRVKDSAAMHIKVK